MGVVILKNFAAVLIFCSRSFFFSEVRLFFGLLIYLLSVVSREKLVLISLLVSVNVSLEMVILLLMRSNFCF